MTKALGQAIQFSGVRRRTIEERLGYSRGYVSKILNGTVELRTRHVFEVLGLIGMEPWRFFQLAFPSPEGEARPVPPPVSEVSETDLDERIRKGLLKILMGTRA